MLREISQSQKDTYYMNVFRTPRAVRLTGSTKVAARGWGREQWGVTV